MGATNGEGFELGVDIYDEINQKWPARPFRNKLVSRKQPRAHAILEDGEYQIIVSSGQNGTCKQHCKICILKRHECGYYTVQGKHSGLYWSMSDDHSKLAYSREPKQSFDFCPISGNENGYYCAIYNPVSKQKMILNATCKSYDYINFVPSNGQPKANQIFYCKRVGKKHLSRPRTMEATSKHEMGTMRQCWINHLQIGDIVDAKINQEETESIAKMPQNRTNRSKRGNKYSSFVC